MYAVFKPELLKKARSVYNQHNLFEIGAISEKDLVSIQLDAFKNILKYVKLGSVFYQEKLADVSFEEIKSFSLES